eukprot:10422446-Ditylum_brightwellii.AAC.1
MHTWKIGVGRWCCCCGRRRGNVVGKGQHLEQEKRGNEPLFIRAARGKSVERAPVWMMCQARKAYVCLPFTLLALPNVSRTVRDSCCHCRSFVSAMACHFIFRSSHATSSHGTGLQCHQHFKFFVVVTVVVA